MKLKIFKGLLFFSSLASLVSCKLENELLFDQPTSIYIDATVDSTIYTFATSPASVTKDTIDIPLRITGIGADVDREVSLVPRASSTAKLGYHYAIGSTVIKANQFAAVVPIYIFRKTGLKDSVLTIQLDIKENENFKLGYTNRLKYKISISDILSKPTNWESAWVGYFGKYSLVKFKFLLEVTGRTDWNSFPFPQDTRYLSQKAKLALLDYNQRFGDLIDENNEIITFP